MIDNTENLSFFSFVSIFGELYTNVLPILWLINEFECPLSVNNLDMFSQGATYLFHLNKFAPKSRSLYFEKSLNIIIKHG